jgi:hypothetical protein
VNRFRTIALTAFAGLVLVACGPAASASPSQGGAASQGASQPASQAAQASQGGPQPSFSQGIAADLEALIPSTVGTLTIQKTSMRGNDYLLSPDSDPETIKFLNDLGVSPNDVSMAFGFGFDSSNNSLVMFVIRAKGASSDKLATAFKAASASGSASPLEWTDATVSGKHVQTATSDGGTTYLYTTGDMVIFLTASDPAAATQIIGGLP